jgi:hypothetical protein
MPGEAAATVERKKEKSHLRGMKNLAAAVDRVLSRISCLLATYRFILLIETLKMLSLSSDPSTRCVW